MTGDGGETRADGVAGPGADAGAELRRELDRRLDELARMTAEAVRPSPAGPAAGPGAADPLPGESGSASRPWGLRRIVRPRARGTPAAGVPGGGRPAPASRGGMLARLFRAIGRALGVRRR